VVILWYHLVYENRVLENLILQYLGLGFAEQTRTGVTANCKFVPAALLFRARKQGLNNTHK